MKIMRKMKYYNSEKLVENETTHTHFFKNKITNLRNYFDIFSFQNCNCVSSSSWPLLLPWLKSSV